MRVGIGHDGVGVLWGHPAGPYVLVPRVMLDDPTFDGRRVAALADVVAADMAADR